jgi:plastocyanin
LRRTALLALLATALAAVVAIPAGARPATTTLKVSAVAAGLKFNVKTLRAHNGKVKIVFTNKGMIPHNFKVERGTKKLGGTKTITKGVTTATLSLKRGTYVFYCSVPGHEAAGMKGKLTVS